MLEVVFLDRATIAPQIKLKELNSKGTLITHEQTSYEQTVPRLKNATIAITNKVVLDEQTLSQLPNLKCICVAATGVNVVDINYCKQNNIVVTNITDYATHTVSEHVFMLMLALSKQLKSYDQTLKEQAWQKANQFCYFTSPISLLKDKTLGLIGTGAIARQTAKIAEAFGMKPIFFSPSGRDKVHEKDCISFPQLLRDSEIISIHCPLTEATDKLIGETEFLQMKESCILINTARGPIVDIKALINAIESKSIAGAALDVLPTEPPEPDDVIMQKLALDNLIITPHTAWASTESMQILADQLIDKVNNYLTDSISKADNLAT